MFSNNAIECNSGRALIAAAVTAIFIVVSGLPLTTQAAASSSPDAVTPDGGQYYGQLVDGKLQAQGKIEWANGAWYEGGFDKGLFSGKGKHRWSTGVVYEGDFKDGVMIGQGRYVDVDGSVYVGHFADNAFNGQGRYELSENRLYEGSFLNGHFDGSGKWTTSVEAYVGEFKNGKYAGKGEIKYKGGRKYTGEFANGKYQGKGRYELPDGQFYEGDFDKDEFTGHGVQRFKEGSHYVGAFKKWHPQGAGTFIYATGDVYVGTFANGELVGKGRFIGKDSSRYEGEFKNTRFDGQGEYRDAKGNEYKGEFKYGMYEGEGVLSYAVPQQDGRTKDSGTWHYGQFEDKGALTKIKVNVETAIYNQRTLLDQTLAALLPHEPGKINLYLLAIGGDGSQEVFHRETAFVRKQFDRDFGTQGRSVVLINSRNTVSEEPMATLTSIRESLTAISSRMDKENDILFLFLTSHGSKDHELTLAQNGMELRNFEAKELGKLLAESGIRWKVVVVSACYAGGFIAPLKDEHTMVITAARHDRTSFGCSDDNDFTYFGKAFFQQSLPKSTSFSDAFNRAKTLVATWEAEDFKAGGKAGEVMHSEPQMYHAAMIDQYLKRWRAQVKKAPQADDVRQTLQAGLVEKK